MGRGDIEWAVGRLADAMAVGDFFYDAVMYHRTLKKAASFLLRSRLFTQNPVYRAAHDRVMRRAMARYERVPHRVMVENTNACNAHCIMCAHDSMKRKKGFMEAQLFRKIADECAELGVGYLSIHGFGEPLLDPHFCEEVRYAKGRGLSRVTTNTNASLMTRELSREIIASGLDEMYISLDAASSASYGAIRKGLDYDATCENIRVLVEEKKQAQSITPMIVVDMVEMESNRAEVEAFTATWKGVVDRVNISTMHNWGGGTREESLDGFHAFRHRRIPCRFLWTDMVIAWNGEVPLCCQDYDDTTLLGDVRTQSIGAIWSGEAIQGYRKKHMEDQSFSIPICKQCKYHSIWWSFK